MKERFPAIQFRSLVPQGSVCRKCEEFQGGEREKERDLSESIIEGASGKGGKVKQVPSTWPIDGQAARGLPPFFPGGAFPEEPRGAVFHSYFHGRDPFIEGCNARRCRNRFRMAHHTRPSSASLFPPRVFP